MGEVAFLLEVDEHAVRNMFRRGELRDVGAGRSRRADPDQIRRTLGPGLAAHALDELIAGRLAAPAARGRTPSLLAVLLAHAGAGERAPGEQRSR